MTTECKNGSISSLREFLNKHKIRPDNDLKDKQNTHTELTTKFSSTYHIADSELDKFYDLYNSALTHVYNNQLDTQFHILERVRNIGPFLIDVDFTYKECKERLYDESHIKYVLKSFKKVTFKFFEAYETKKLIAYVTEKAKPCPDIKKDKVCGYRDGFHITFPHFIVNTETFKNVLIELGKIVSDFNNPNNPFRDLKNHIIIDKKEKIIDTSIPTNNWYLYNSQKPNGLKYALTSKYNHKLEKIEFDISEKTVGDLVKIMSIRNKYNNPLVPLKKFSLEKEKLNDKTKNNLKDNLEEKSLDSCTTKSPPKPRKLESQTTRLQKRNDFMQPITMARLLVPLLKKQRASSYESWRDVGLAIHHTSPTLFDVFNEFSKKDMVQYNNGGGEDGCRKFWNKFKPAKENTACLSIASIFLWAKEDSPNRYKNVLRTQLGKLFDEAASCSDISIARITYNLFRYEYVCASITNNIWYQFRGHRWERIEAGYTLFDKINVDLSNYFAERQCNLATNNNKDDMCEELLDTKINNYNKKNHDHKEEYECEDEKEAIMQDFDAEKYKNLSKIVLKLHDSGFVNKIMKVCEKLMFREKFIENLDENPDLICFDNGIYDLRTQSFRNGTPDDMCSKTTGYSYPVNYHSNKKKIQRIKQYFSQVLPKEDVRDYFVKLIASFTCGRNPDQKFYISTGRGGAGKTQTLDLVLAAFGEYAGTLPITLLTRESKGAGSATPELVDIKGKRFILFSEPEHGDKLYIGLLKKLTGSEKIKARGLYESLIEFMPQAKYMILCNEDLPEINSTDTGIWRRMNVIPFIAQFLARQDVKTVSGKQYYRGRPLTEYQHLRDPKLPDEMKTWAKAFMWMLLNEYYPAYLKNFQEPEDVTFHSRMYEKNSNIHLDFVDTTYTITGSAKDKIPVSEFFTDFKTWLNNSHSGLKYKTSKKDVETFIKRWDHPKVKLYKDHIFGLSFCANLSNVDEVDEDIMACDGPVYKQKTIVDEFYKDIKLDEDDDVRNMNSEQLDNDNNLEKSNNLKKSTKSAKSCDSTKSTKSIKSAKSNKSTNSKKRLAKKLNRSSIIPVVSDYETDNIITDSESTYSEQSTDDRNKKIKGKNRHRKIANSYINFESDYENSLENKSKNIIKFGSDSDSEEYID